ncbi:glycosyltransferase [Selenomonas sp. KH1T6]|uniref:glycosyltransferase n=1 Tax=Selenomonas sp. KH1T6 TaxID=3158784 RepID=UPI0008A8005D|nr:Glycosyltransferase involved in cell wall bisynthesis [Selenomonas ruminantium]
MRILFVSATRRTNRPYEDPSVRYRCYYPAAELIKMGHYSYVISAEKFQKNFETLPDFDVYIFHRPSFSERFFEIREVLRNKVFVADYDDYTLDIKLTNDMPRVKSGTSSLNATSTVISNFFEGAALCDYYTASTDDLRNKIKKIFKIPSGRIITVHNGVPEEFVSLSRLAKEKMQNNRYTFGYFPGTTSHDIDWTIFNDAMKKMQLKEKCTLLLAGPLVVDKTNPDLRIVRHGYVEFSELPFLMAQCKAVVAPLEATDFNASKSGLKFWESALCGCRVLATPIPDIDRFESPALLKCHNDEEWQKNIQRVIEDDLPSFDAEELKNIEKQTSAKSEAMKLYAFLEEAVKENANL